MPPSASYGSNVVWFQKGMEHEKFLSEACKQAREEMKKARPQGRQAGSRVAPRACCACANPPFGVIVTKPLLAQRLPATIPDR